MEEINCTLVGGCMYDSSVRGSRSSGSRPWSDADFAQVMIAYPSVTLAAAARAWRKDFPGKLLLITEFEMQWPATGGSGPKDTTAAGSFVRNAVDSGAHAVFYGAAVVAALDSAGTIASIHHHGKMAVSHLWIWLPRSR